MVAAEEAKMFSQLLCLYYPHLRKQWRKSRTLPRCQDKPLALTPREPLGRRQLIKLWLKMWYFVSEAKIHLRESSFFIVVPDSVNLTVLSLYRGPRSHPSGSFDPRRSACQCPAPTWKLVTV
ncbi:hypothetical protein WMY93_029171 [Mugilogobius chulae]|uniref:Uncharacterized protein n=1 Tax=Mugilogobius chulae TaxID=88201 RepID=A0AAW0MQF2_9GOBI